MRTDANRRTDANSEFDITVLDFPRIALYRKQGSQRFASLNRFAPPFSEFAEKT